LTGYTNTTTKDPTSALTSKHLTRLSQMSCQNKGGLTGSLKAVTIVPISAQAEILFFMKHPLALSFLLLLPLLLPASVSAAVDCETQYGGGEVCVKTGQLQIDKKVFDPQSQKFIDNLGITSWKFTSGDEITFKLMVKNVGDATYNTVDVTDILPDFLELVSGNVNFRITDLTSEETEEREIKVKVVSAEKFPADKSVLCVVNAAKAVSGDERNRDTAQVCLEKKVLGIKKSPEVGPKNSTWVILGSTMLGLLGLIFINKSDYSKQTLFKKGGENQ
ncbi:MAG: hypothetical protein UX99_C0019G0019, partial [Candidatus Amesbacteria bacterium GW2011_GWB1_47_26]